MVARHLLASLFVIVCCVLLWVGAIALAAGHPPNENARVLRAKLERAIKSPSPKLLLLGGSTVRYSFSAQTIEKETGVPTTNMAVSVNVGLDYLLHLARQALQSGDLVVIAFEYSFYDYDDSINKTNAPLALWNDMSWVGGLPLAERILWGRNLRPLHVWTALQARYRGFTGWRLQGDYTAWGDQTTHNATDATRRYIASLLAEQTGREVYVVRPDANSVRALRAFIAWCQQRGVRVAAAWPTYLEPLLNRQAFGLFVAEVQRLYDEQSVPMLGRVEDSLLPASLMFDSSSHPTDEGTRLRTQNIIADLRRAGLVIPR